MDLGKKLMLLRIQSGMSVEDLAEKLGVHYITIYQWQKNKFPPKLKHLVQLAKIFNIEIMISPSGEMEFHEKKKLNPIVQLANTLTQGDINEGCK